MVGTNEEDGGVVISLKTKLVWKLRVEKSMQAK